MSDTVQTPDRKNSSTLTLSEGIAESLESFFEDYKLNYQKGLSPYVSTPLGHSWFQSSGQGNPDTAYW